MVDENNNNNALGGDAEEDVVEANLQSQEEVDNSILQELAFLTLLSVADLILSIVTVFSGSFVQVSRLFDSSGRLWDDGWGLLNDSSFWRRSIRDGDEYLKVRENNAQGAAKVFAIASMVTASIGLSIIIFLMFSLCRYGKRFYNAGIRASAIIFLTTAMMQAQSLHYSYNFPMCEAVMIYKNWNHEWVCDFGRGGMNAMAASVLSTFLGAWLMSLAVALK